MEVVLRNLGGAAPTVVHLFSGVGQIVGERRSTDPLHTRQREDCHIQSSSTLTGEGLW